ncbi:MAG: flavodoxin family protein [Dehalococcoidia bacterium]|nr:flavodoxin family protein [Dehalococcoidia bacterium]
MRILIAYYSRTGNTEQMARSVVEGTKRVPAVYTVLRKVSEVSKEDLNAADGIVLGCPTYFANIPGEMKTIIDDWNWKMKVDFTDKVGGAFATAGGRVGGQGHVVVSLLMFMLHNRMVVAGWWFRICSSLRQRNWQTWFCLRRASPKRKALSPILREGFSGCARSSNPSVTACQTGK